MKIGEIENGVKYQPKQGRQKSEIRKQIESLEKGQSFCVSVDSEKEGTRVRLTASQVSVKMKVKISVAKESASTLRVYRLA
jgi:endo-beta-N-acetylglucosaminidase D